MNEAGTHEFTTELEIFQVPSFVSTLNGSVTEVAGADMIFIF
jgi:hypothetical protein